MIVGCREMCGWKFKDDYHDAVALAYYGWHFCDDPSAFIRKRDPRLQKCYEAHIARHKLNGDGKRYLAKAKALLHREFPSKRKVRQGAIETPHQLWAFIAGRWEEMNPKTVTRYRRELESDIGTASKTGSFSPELVRLAGLIWDYQSHKAEYQEIYHEVCSDPDFKWISDCLEKEFKMGVILRSLLICQIYPFSDFVDEKGNELRKKLRAKTPKGYNRTRRVGLGRFHARLGRGKFPIQSGKRQGYQILGSRLCRNEFFLWADSVIARRTSKSGQTVAVPPMVKLLWDRFDQDTNSGNALTKELTSVDAKELASSWGTIQQLTKNNPEAKKIVDLLTPLIKEGIEKGSAVSESACNAILGDWARSRACDKTTKLIFHRLRELYKSRL